MSTKNIIWLDDEPHFTSAYADVLVESIPSAIVRRLRTAPDALEFLLSAQEPPDLLIWDLIMPPGDELTLVETREGLRTGEVLFHRFRHRWGPIPAILFTNVTTPAFLQRYDSSDECSFAALKRDLLPDDFLSLVRRALRLAPEEEGF